MQTTALLKQLLSEWGISTRSYYDRLHIYFDAQTTEENLTAILNDNPKNQLLRKPLPHNEHLDRQLALFHPSNCCLKQLTDSEIVAGDCAINYAELALDFTSQSKGGIERLVNFINKHLVHIPNNLKLAYHNQYEDTVYFSAQSDKERLTFYDDKPDRFGSDDLCLHLEFRLQGLKTVKDRGLITLKNLIQFDHDQLWDSLLDFRSPNLTQLGALCDDRDVSRQSNHKRGNKEWAAIESLQKYLTKFPERKSAFKRMTPENLGKSLQKRLAARN